MARRSAGVKRRLVSSLLLKRVMNLSPLFPGICGPLGAEIGPPETSEPENTGDSRLAVHHTALRIADSITSRSHDPLGTAL